jgi:hypothetical protein
MSTTSAGGRVTGVAGIDLGSPNPATREES